MVFLFENIKLPAIHALKPTATQLPSIYYLKHITRWYSQFKKYSYMVFKIKNPQLSGICILKQKYLIFLF
jgi:hypothetical protein